MSEEYLISSYNKSKNYEMLFELIKVHKIICFVKLENDDDFHICESQKQKTSKFINIGVFGTTFISLQNKDSNVLKAEFLELCNTYELEFLQPISKDLKC